jgi:hypothetical protein
MTIAAKDFARGDEVMEQSGDFRCWHISDTPGQPDHVRY